MKKQANKPISLNKNNYYDSSTDLIYQSPTFFKKFLACEAETMAEIKGDWKPKPAAKGKDNLIQGNYLHSYFESHEAHEKFLKEHHGDIYKSKSAMYASFDQVDRMIDCLESDPSFSSMYQGDKESIVTGRIGETLWKGKIDCLNLDKGYFIDLKTTKSITKHDWNEEQRTKLNFVYNYNYQLQMAVYQELILQTLGVWCTPYIVAVSKEDPPDKEMLSIPEYRLSEALDLIEQKQPHIDQVRRGEVEPVRCGKCDYCRATKVLDKIVSTDDL